jgi:hydrogenase/urease accessory protein HupE
MSRSWPVLALLWVLAFSVPARAHDPFEITAVGQVRPRELVMQLTMAQSTSLLLRRGDASEAALQTLAHSFFKVTSRGAPLPLQSERHRVTEERDVEIDLVFAPPLDGPLRFEGALLDALSETHGVALSVTTLEPPRVLGVALLTRDEPSLEVLVPARGLADTRGAAANVDSAEAPSPTPEFSTMFALGVEHILTGYDHLLFLAGLLVACRRLRTMLGVVTSFTVAHSVTLALAGLGLVELSSGVVEPLIAASIVFVGVENLWLRDEPRWRWALTFAFGLVHGFGFAGVLGELGLGQSGTSLVMPLLAFNLGVEAGQLAVALVVLPLLLWLRRRGWFEKRELYATSLAVALLGAHWFLERTVFAERGDEVAATSR